MGFLPPGGEEAHFPKQTDPGNHAGGTDMAKTAAAGEKSTARMKKLNETKMILRQPLLLVAPFCFYCCSWSIRC